MTTEAELASDDDFRLIRELSGKRISVQVSTIHRFSPMSQDVGRSAMQGDDGEKPRQPISGIDLVIETIQGPVTVRFDAHTKITVKRNPHSSEICEIIVVNECLNSSRS